MIIQNKTIDLAMLMSVKKFKQTNFEKGKKVYFGFYCDFVTKGISQRNRKEFRFFSKSERDMNFENIKSERKRRRNEK